MILARGAKTSHPAMISQGSLRDPGREKLPVLSAAITRSKPVVRFLTVIVAPGSAAPFASTTRPRRLPSGICAGVTSMGRLRQSRQEIVAFKRERWGRAARRCKWRNDRGVITKSPCDGPFHRDATMDFPSIGARLGRRGGSDVEEIETGCELIFLVGNVRIINTHCP